jgi:hypothetical protein
MEVLTKPQKTSTAKKVAAAVSDLGLIDAADIS